MVLESNVMEALLSNVKKPNLEIFGFLVSQTESYEEVNYIVNQLIMLGLKPSKKFFEVLAPLAEDYEESVKIINYMKSVGIKPHRNIYIYTAVATKNSFEARALIELMKLEGEEIVPVFYCNLIEKLNTFEESMQVLAEMKAVNYLPNDMILYRIMKKAKNEYELNTMYTELEIYNYTFNEKLYQGIKTVSSEELRKELRKAYKQRFGQCSFSDVISSIINNVNPQKIKRQVDTYLRNEFLVSHLKVIYHNTCAVCGERLSLDKQDYYSEVHHIHPLSHSGPDILENMIVLCPNHHVQFDKGAITIDLERKVVIHVNKSDYINGRAVTIKHTINNDFVDYHNRYIFRGKIFR